MVQEAEHLRLELKLPELSAEKAALLRGMEVYASHTKPKSGKPGASLLCACMTIDGLSNLKEFRAFKLGQSAEARGRRVNAPHSVRLTTEQKQPLRGEAAQQSLTGPSSADAPCGAAVKVRAHQQELDRQQLSDEEEQQRQHRQQWQQQQPRQAQRVPPQQPPSQQGATHAEARRTLPSSNAKGRPRLSQWPLQPQQYWDTRCKQAGSSSNNGRSLQPFVQQQQQQQLGPTANTDQYQKASMLLFQPSLGPQVAQQKQQGQALHDAAAAASAAQMKALHDLACDLEQADEALESSRRNLPACRGPYLSSTTDSGAASPSHSTAATQHESRCSKKRAADTRQPKAAPHKRRATAAAEGPRAAHRGCGPNFVRGKLQQQSRKAAQSTGLPQAAAAAESAAAAAGVATSCSSSRVSSRSSRCSRDSGTAAFECQH
ncbi:hypothetical protein Esti_003540 [Eimeria stiedai]